eukprot:TRINITY_DN2825_c0_g1_i3.p1 TRINITY_DN2825_c0_g1~~TRINITY_DN2825_c0_g1_i3.p1  ORF type:complete len:643 (+),score=225.01 TRINITY_DN2825_c0_g1_i3:58-1986(+)
MATARNRVEVLLGHLASEPSIFSRSLVPALVSAQQAPENSKKPPTPAKHGGALVAQVLKEQGVKFVFTLTGGHIAPILVGCNQAGLKVVDVRDEAAAVFAADAMARVSGIPGVAIVTAGPGLTNTITAVKNAQLAESPLVVLAGATSMLLKGRGSLQDIDQLALMEPHVKWMHSMTRVREIIPSLRKAFAIASSGVPGPVFLEYPLDVLWPQETINELVLGNQPQKTNKKFELTLANLKSTAQDLYIRRHIAKVFDQAFEPDQSFSGVIPSPILRPPAQRDIAAVLKALSGSQKPLVVLGSQATLHPAQIDALRRALEVLQVPVYCSGMARGLLGTSHPLQMRHKRREALAAADFVLLAGAVPDFRLDYGRHIKKAFFVMVNLSRVALKKNSDIRRRDIAIQYDPCDLMLKLAQNATSINLSAATSRWSSWMSWLQQNEAKREKEIDAMASPAKKGVNPVVLCRALNRALDDDSIIVADGGDFVGTASYIVHPRKPLSWLDPGVFGTLGVGGGFAVAAKANRPQAEVWLLFGDGSSAWSLAEVDTMVRHGLPCIIVIGNDAAWQQMHRDQVRLLKDPVASELLFSHYERVGEGYGGEGLLIRNESEIEATFQKAKALAKSGRPVVVNVFLGKSDFRQGSISL